MFCFYVSWFYDLEYISYLIFVVFEDYVISLLYGMWRFSREGGGDCCCFCEVCWLGIRVNCYLNI